jgi:predicted RNase H-like nuclease (RuvC/YqgF family)
MNPGQLANLADKAKRDIEESKRGVEDSQRGVTSLQTKVTSLEAGQQELGPVIAELRKITTSLRNQLFELSRNQKALIESVRLRAPEVYALFSDLRNDSKTHPSVAEVPSVQELEQLIEAFLGRNR